MDSFRRGRGLYNDIPWGRGSMGPWDGKGPPPVIRGRFSRKTDSEVRKIRNEERNGTWFGQSMSESVNSA